MPRDARASFSIGEIAQQVGVRPSAIRFYEAKGLLPSPDRKGGKRRYDSSAVKRLTLIGYAQRAGFTIGEIRELLTATATSSPSARWRSLAARKLPEIRSMMQEAREMERWLNEGLRCNCVEIDDCRLLTASGGRPPFRRDKPRHTKRSRR